MSTAPTWGVLLLQIRLSKLKPAMSSFGGNKNGQKNVGFIFRQKIARGHRSNCLPLISIPVPL
jgi:hypothetical protein